MADAANARRGHVDPTRPVVTGSWAAGPRLRRVVRLGAVAAAVALVCACENTSIAGLNVRAGPSTTTGVVASLGESGTDVTIACHTRGEPVHGDPVWYRITRPHAGYVTNYYIRTSGDVLERTPSC